MESSSKFGRGELGSAFCCVDGFIISRLYFLCHIFPQTSELNSKSYLLQGGTAIQNGDDMDNYKSPGSYYLALTNDISSLKNAPNFTSAFTMKVEYGNGTAYPCQIYTECTTGRKAFRYFNSTYKTWQPFVYFSDDATVLKSAQNMVLPNYKAASESDADNYMDNYSNPLPNDTHYFTIVNLSVSHSSLGGGGFLVEGTKTTNQWEWQKATKYNTTSGIEIHARTKRNGTWGEWKLIFPSS